MEVGDTTLSKEGLLATSLCRRIEHGGLMSLDSTSRRGSLSGPQHIRQAVGRRQAHLVLARLSEDFSISQRAARYSVLTGLCRAVETLLLSQRGLSGLAE